MYVCPVTRNSSLNLIQCNCSRYINCIVKKLLQCGTAPLRDEVYELIFVVSTFNHFSGV